MIDRSAQAWGGASPDPAEADLCACDVDLRAPRVVKAFGVRGWSRVAMQAVLASGTWTDGSVQIYRSVNGRDYLTADNVGALATGARTLGNIDPRGCAFLIAVIENGSKATVEAFVTLYCSGDRAQVLGSDTTAPVDASYVVIGLNGDLTAERVLAVGTGLTLTDGGAGGNATLSLDADLVTLAGLTPVRGSIIVGNASPAWSVLAIGTSGKYLRSDGTDAAWTAIAAADLPTGIDAAKIGAGAVSNAEFGYLDGVTSAIQGQIDGKAPVGEAFVTIGATGNLSAERALTGTANQVVITDNGANSTVVLSLPQSIDTGASVTFLNVTLGNGGALRTAATSGSTLLLQARDVDGAAYTTFITLTANNTPTCDLDDAVTKAGNYIYRAGGTDVPVTDGGTGVSTLTTAYGTLCAGTTATGAVQTVSPGTAGQVLRSNGNAALPTYQSPKRSFGFAIRGTPAVGLVGYVTVPEACTIVKVRLIADVAINAVVDIKKVSYASWPTTASIVASAPPTIAANKSEDSTLTGWTTALAAGDILEFRISSLTIAAGLSFFGMELEVTVP